MDEFDLSRSKPLHVAVDHGLAVLDLAHVDSPSALHDLQSSPGEFLSRRSLTDRLLLRRSVSMVESYCTSPSFRNNELASPCLGRTNSSPLSLLLKVSGGPSHSADGGCTRLWPGASRRHPQNEGRRLHQLSHPIQRPAASAARLQRGGKRRRGVGRQDDSEPQVADDDDDNDGDDDGGEFGIASKSPRLSVVVAAAKVDGSTCFSPSIASVMHACSLSDKPNLTADRSRNLSLPTVSGHSRNRDLNNIDCHTMANLMRGCYDDRIASFRIIDARYEYEYLGGHILGAENFGLWDEGSFMSTFLPESLMPKKVDLRAAMNVNDESRHILIFHCEFSSARGPKLLRELRKRDRFINCDTYPALHYPECYLLHEGYKNFYAHYPELCDPQSYVPMTHPEFVSEERTFHRKSRSWAPAAPGALPPRRPPSPSLAPLSAN